MMALAQIEARIDALGNGEASAACGPTPAAVAAELLGLGEAMLEAWIIARGQTPTRATREGFRLLALHGQGARGEPSFNACRETCRELVYHFNLIAAEPAHAGTARRVRLMRLVTKHLLLFVSGKLEVAGLGEFCCAAKPVRQGAGSE